MYPQENPRIQETPPRPDETALDVPLMEELALLSLRGNVLEKLYDYFIKEKHGDPIPFDKKAKFGLFLELLGGTGGIYAWPPAWDYGNEFAPWIAYSFAIANPISNSLFLIKATDDLIDTILTETSAPKEMAAFIDLPSKKGLAAKYLKMGAGSLVCVVPFSIAVYLFPLPKCTTKWCIGLILSHATLSNTILHGISWSLILKPEYWYYRLPILPFEKLYSLIKTCFKSPAQIEQLKLMSEQEVIYGRYKRVLIDTLAAAAQRIVTQHLKKEGTALRTIQGDDASLIQFVELANSSLALTSAASAQSSCCANFFNKAHRFLSKGGVGFLGAGIMLAGCIGWIANPFYIGLLEGLNIGESIAAGSLPSYSTAVLCAFYGAGIFNQMYSYLTTWNGSVRDKFSPEIRMYPKTFALFMLANLYVSFFSFASGAQLIRTVFADKMWDDVRPALEKISMATLMLLSLMPLIDLFNLVVRKSLAKLGSVANDDTLAARLLVKMTFIAQAMQRMKGEELMQSIARYSAENQQALGLDPERFVLDLQRVTELQQQRVAIQGNGAASRAPSVASLRSSFFYSESRDGAQQAQSTRPVLAGHAR